MTTKAALLASASLGTAIADAEEQGDKNREISDAAKMDQLCDMMRDACAKMDSVSTRMDAIEENQRRADARMDAVEKDRKDADEEEEGKPKEPAADRKDADEEKEEKREDRKDAEEDRKDAKEDERVDRKDSEEEKEEKREDRKDSRKDSDEEEEERKDAMADDAPMTRAEAAALRRELASLQGRMPAMLTDSDRERYAAAQEMADPAFQAFGDRAPAPLDGETVMQYKRRLGTKLQAHSSKWKDVRLSGISDEQTLDVMVGDIFADSIIAARRGAEVRPGELRAHERHSGGHTIIEYEGAPETWMNPMAGHTLRATGDWKRPH